MLPVVQAQLLVERLARQVVVEDHALVGGELREGVEVGGALGLALLDL